MKLVDIEEFINRGYKTHYIFDAPGFHEVNSYKVDNIVGMLFGRGKVRAGILAGVKDCSIKMPYSSPFAMIELYKTCGIEDFDEYVKDIDAYALEKGIEDINITLPPMFYDETNISKFLSALMRNGYTLKGVELNYQYLLVNEETYKNNLLSNARKNLNTALCNNYTLKHCDDLESKVNAYEIIRINRQSKNYHLSMSWDDIERTINLVEHDFFILYLNNIPIAASMIFRVTKDIYQVIYWGDVPGYNECRPMNYLAYVMYLFYLKKGARFLDIGPSMLDGQPNYGLCNFKESIGCSVSSKFIVEKKWRK